jgi:hypothetical protein
MAVTVVFNEADPCIGITLEEVPPGTPGRAQGTHGTCTECGWPMHRWDRDKAIRDAQAHVDGHAPVLIGGDTDSLIRG